MARLVRRLTLAASLAALVIGTGAQAASAGEITGNGTLKEMHGRSICSFSGQEDLQWYFDDGNTMRKPVATRGVPGRAQSWGQIPKAVRDVLPSYLHPSSSCNGHTGFFAG